MINGQTLEDEINKPKHYRSHESGIEAIEVTRWLNFDLGNCWKYSMRYRDKGTPKKDLGKAVWYLNDFKEHFIDYKNDSTIMHKIPEEIISKMIAISEAEPREEIKRVFELLIMIATQNCVLDPKLYDRTGYELEQFANSL
jgi:hypothetical protein